MLEPKPITRPITRGELQFYAALIPVAAEALGVPIGQHAAKSFRAIMAPGLDDAQLRRLLLGTQERLHELQGVHDA